MRHFLLSAAFGERLLTSEVTVRKVRSVQPNVCESFVVRRYRIPSGGGCFSGDRADRPRSPEIR